MNGDYRINFTGGDDNDFEQRKDWRYYMDKFYVYRCAELVQNVYKKLLDITEPLYNKVWEFLALAFVCILCIVAVAYAGNEYSEFIYLKTSSLLVFIFTGFVTENVLKKWFSKNGLTTVRILIMAFQCLLISQTYIFATIELHSWFSESIVLFWSMLCGLVKSTYSFSEKEMEELVTKILKNENTVTL
ncbi:hypothetical protein BDAP_000441 [Binucleata daphniae]